MQFFLFPIVGIHSGVPLQFILMVCKYRQMIRGCLLIAIIIKISIRQLININMNNKQVLTNDNSIYYIELI